MKNAIKIVLAVALVAALVNDLGRWAKARYDVGVIAADTAAHVARSRHESRDRNATEAARYAAEHGVTVFAFDQDESRVRVFAQMPVKNTWLLAPAAALLGGSSLDAPFYVHTDEAASFR